MAELLLSYDEIRSGLGRVFADAPAEFRGEGLFRPSSVSRGALGRCAKRLREPLPPALADALLRFDFGSLSIGRVTFGDSGDYLHDLVDQNEPSFESWWTGWEGGVRPAGRLLVASSDPYAVLINTQDGSIEAFLHEEHWTSAVLIAVDFERFVRGLGTLYLGARDPASGNTRTLPELAAAVAVASGADPVTRFWQEMVR